LSIPIHALIIAGVKADTLLPPSLESWYRNGLEKAKQQGSDRDKINTVNSEADNDNISHISQLTLYKPRYIDLAQLLQLSFPARN